MMVTVALWKIILTIVFVGVSGFYCGYYHRVLKEEMEDED